MQLGALKQLPLGTSDFPALRQEGQIYVDKSRMIFELASQRRKFFFSRPRRFGKSLLISAFESLFRHGTAEFQGLAIEHLWQDKSAYSVVRLDFSTIKQFSDLHQFIKQFEELLASSFSKIGFIFNSNSGFSLLRQLSDWMLSIPRTSLVILVDEYDAPLTVCLDDPERFEEIRNVLSAFYAVLKSNDAPIRFLFITGITKFSKTTIFSELNNLSDISLSPKYGALLGYTHDDVRTYFREHLTYAAEVLSTTPEALFEELASQYDGFCFEETARQKVFAPWSLLSFFAEPERGLKNYWFESGGQPRMLLEYVKSHSVRKPEEYENEKKLQLDDLSASSNLQNLDDNLLLTQAGYLTIKAVRGSTVTLGYPNREVASSMGRLYAESMLNKDAMNRAGEGYLSDFLRDEDFSGFVAELNRLILGIDYARFPIHDEASCRGAVHLMLACARLTATPENHNALGRSDLEVMVGRTLWVFEFKFARSGQSADRLCRDGAEQAALHRYGEQRSAAGLNRAVLVFSEDERQFSAFSCSKISGS
ncbi:MAG: AAA family ATPase [Sutterella sp.]|nr:AAA family ATPase [Sutterella sp.]